MASAPRSPSYAEATRTLLRSTLLEAARELASERPWREVTMAAIAGRAGVSRQTLYNEFGSRGALSEALVLHEVDRFVGAVADTIRHGVGDPAAAIAGALGIFLHAAAEDPVVRALLAEDGGREELLPLVTAEGRPLLEHATEALAALVRETWPFVAEGESRFLAETIVRLAISYVVLPVDRIAPTVEGVTALIRPYVTDLLARADDDAAAA
jgi:AcrR family transcriptional regulator